MLMVTKLTHLAVFPNVKAGIRKSVRSKRKPRTLFPPNKQNQDDNSAEKLNGDERASPAAFLCGSQCKQKQRDTQPKSDRTAASGSGMICCVFENCRVLQSYIR